MYPVLKPGFMTRQNVKCVKNTKTEAVFNKIEMNNEWNMNLPQIVALAFCLLIPVSFILVKEPLKFFF